MAGKKVHFNRNQKPLCYASGFEKLTMNKDEVNCCPCIQKLNPNPNAKDRTPKVHLDFHGKPLCLATAISSVARVASAINCSSCFKKLKKMPMEKIPEYARGFDRD